MTENEKDTERLNWMDENMAGGTYSGTEWSILGDLNSTLRQTIDLAIKNEKEKEK